MYLLIFLILNLLGSILNMILGRYGLQFGMNDCHSFVFSVELLTMSFVFVHTIIKTIIQGVLLILCFACGCWLSFLLLKKLLLVLPVVALVLLGIGFLSSLFPIHHHHHWWPPHSGVWFCHPPCNPVRWWVGTWIVHLFPPYPGAWLHLWWPLLWIHRLCTHP